MNETNGKPYQPLIRHTSNPLQFEVQSMSRSRQHHNVDLAAYKFNGSCTCEHFWMRLEKLVKNEGHASSDRTRCKHIIAARVFFCQLMLKAVAQDMERTAKKTNRQEY